MLENSTMEKEYLDKCLSIVEDDDAYKEKTRIAEVAAATLCRLNGIMKQMKDWRDDRVKLRSNIWRLKLALRVAGRETDDTLHADPLIEHQKAEIKRLEGANQGLKRELTDIKTALLERGYMTQGIAWNPNGKLVEVKQDYLGEIEHLKNEIQYLKSRLNETEEGHEHSSEVEHLKCKLKNFMMVDHTMEIIFTDIVNKVAETIANLSGELVNVNERFHRSQLRNDSLYVEIDKLKAMLRFKSGNIVDYQRRISELDNLTKRLKTELNKLKDNCRGDSWRTDSNYQYNFGIVERLTNELRSKLQNDHKALLSAGDPDCLKYMQKIVELRAVLTQLHVVLGKFSEELRLPNPDSMVEYNKYLKQLSILDSTLKEINIEIDKLKNDHVKKNWKLGSTEVRAYLNKIEGLESIVEKARTTMNGLNRRAEGNSKKWKDIEKLEGFVGRVCHEIKQLEVMVASEDSASMFKRVEQMEELIVRLRTELNEKNQRMNTLSEELFDMESLHEQNTKELNDTQKKLSALMEENRSLKNRTKEMEERTSELQHEQESTSRELEQLQQVKRDVSAMRKKLQCLQMDKEGLLMEIGKIRDTLQRKNDEIKTILSEKGCTEKSLNAKIMDLMRNLQAAFKENEKLQSKVNELERFKCKELGTLGVEMRQEIQKYSREKSKSTDAEVQRLRTNLATSIESLENANREIADLKAKLEHSSSENARLEASVSQLEARKENLVYQLGIEQATAEGRLKELGQLKSDYDRVNVEMTDLKKEKEQINANLMNLKHDNDLLQKSVGHARDRCYTLENEIEKCKSEAESLRRENEHLKTNEENLNNKLRDLRTELSGAGDKISRLEFENSRLQDELNGVTLKNAGLEGRLQVLLSEKYELATRIIELDKESVRLKDQLNEVKAKNECSSIELNKLRTEHDKARSEYTGLQSELEVARKTNDELNESNEVLKQKLNEINSDFRILENQLKILQVINATTTRDKELLEREYVNLLRSLKMEQHRSVMCGESMYRQRNEQTTEKDVNEIKRINAKTDKRTAARAKMTEAKQECEKLLAENESLKFEILNLKNRNFEVGKALSRTKGELHRQKMELAEKQASATTINANPNKLEIVNLYYKEVNNYSSRCSEGMGAMARIEHSTVYPYDGPILGQETGTDVERLFEFVNKLKVENIALKMEVNSLRCSLVANFTKDEKWKSELEEATEEIHALKAELTKLRDEKESLRVQLDATRTKLNRLESEKIALKDELYALRKINSDLKQKASELRYDYKTLKERSAGFEDCIMKAVKKIKKYTMNADDRETSDNDLIDLLKKYISNEEILCSIEQEMNIERI